ncbi:pentatricopeptide repeat-containing protein [Tanacetum coccineum]
MILQNKLTNFIPISTSLNPKPHKLNNNHLPAKLLTFQTPLKKPIKTLKPKPTITTTPSDILRLLDTLRFPVPDAVYISLIKECTQCQDSNESVLVHTHMTKTHKKRLSLSLVNRVLIMYVSCGSLDNARKVFDEMSKKDFNSWAIMIAGYADNGEYEEVIRLFVNDKFRYIMYSCGSFPVSWIMVCVLKACGETMNVELGEQVHGWLMKSGYSDDLFVGSSLISFYGKVGCFEDGDMVFDQIGSRRNVVVWTARIINNCKEERFREVFEVFNEMGKEGVRKNSFTLSSVLSACSKITDDGNCGEQVHANAIKLGLASKSYVQCGLVNMYGKFGLINDAKRVRGLVTNKKRKFKKIVTN